MESYLLTQRPPVDLTDITSQKKDGVVRPVDEIKERYVRCFTLPSYVGHFHPVQRRLNLLALDSLFGCFHMTFSYDRPVAAEKFCRKFFIGREQDFIAPIQ